MSTENAKGCLGKKLLNASHISLATGEQHSLRPFDQYPLSA